MIKYSKLSMDTEIPCMVCGRESNVVFVKNMQPYKEKHILHL